MKTTITENGGLRIPPELLHEMNLIPGQIVSLEKVSATEFRLVVLPNAQVKPDPIAALGFAKEHGLETMPTEEWMKLLREGEKD